VAPETAFQHQVMSIFPSALQDQVLRDMDEGEEQTRGVGVGVGTGGAQIQLGSLRQDELRQTPAVILQENPWLASQSKLVTQGLPQPPTEMVGGGGVGGGEPPMVEIGKSRT
jgi:hypothetical protein